MLFRSLMRGALIFMVATLFFTTLFITAYVVRVYRTFTLVDQATMMNQRDTGLTLYDRHGQLFFTFDRAQFKQAVPLSAIPPHVQHAIITAEDRDFTSHHGLSFKGITRSALLNFQQQRLSFGGSTITQQLVKNTYFTPEKSISRKFFEAIVAVKLEQQFSKNEILTMYLNSAYFGHNVFGIEAAAHTYFGKSAATLNLTEATFLASILPAPSHLAPPLSATNATHPNELEDLRDRQHIVLKHMEEDGHISPRERVAAELAPLTLTASGLDINQQAPHFALLVRDTIYERFGRETAIRQGLHVTTTIDLNWQHQAETSVREQVEKLHPRRATNGAAVVMDPTTGHLLAMVGSVDWHTDEFGKINMALHPRQTGSAIKPFVYAAALEDKIITPASILLDRPHTFGTNYQPKNYDGRFRGPVTVRYALGNSLNIPAVEVADRVGPHRIIDYGLRAGLTSFAQAQQAGLALALGAHEVTLFELVSAFSTFATGGVYHPPVFYTAISNKLGQPLAVPAPTATVVFSPSVAWQITSILSDNRTRRPTFGTLLELPFSAAVKTGTSQDYRDAWTVGYTPAIVAGVWVGNSDNSPMYELAGATGAVPIWQDIMKFTTPSPPPEFIVPPTIIARRTCGSIEYYAPDALPQRERCPRHASSPSPLPPPSEQRVSVLD